MCPPNSRSFLKYPSIPFSPLYSPVKLLLYLLAPQFLAFRLSSHLENTLVLPMSEPGPQRKYNYQFSPLTQNVSLSLNSHAVHIFLSTPSYQAGTLDNLHCSSCQETGYMLCDLKVSPNIHRLKFNCLCESKHEDTIFEMQPSYKDRAFLSGMSGPI